MFSDAGVQVTCRFPDVDFGAGCTFDGVNASGRGDGGFSRIFNDVFDGFCGAGGYVQAQITEVSFDRGKEGGLR